MSEPQKSRPWQFFPVALLSTLMISPALMPDAASARSAERLTPLAPRPDWNALEQYQETITREDFLRLLTGVYVRGGAFEPFLRVESDRVLIRKESENPTDLFILRFAGSRATAKAPPRYWTPAAGMPPTPANRPLAGITIALDPGHIGGEFARMEERWFQIGEGKPVTEGDMVLIAGRHLARALAAHGAKVVWVRDSTKPVTRQRPRDFRNEARQILQRSPGPVRESYRHRNEPGLARTVQWQSELLFYRNSEIRARALRVNERLRPDLTVCLHFNAEPWGNANNPQLVDLNHLHLLINGTYSRGELSLDDVRFDMVLRLLQRIYPEELAASEAVADAMARATGLPPYTYKGGNAFQAGDSPYVWVRNLLANRLFLSPVVFLEPYVMNSREVYARVQAGDYDGKREFDGKMKESIYREYARGVTDGIVRYYREHRGKP